MIEIKLSSIFYVISLILIIAASIQIFYYMFFYIRVCCVKRKPKSHTSQVPISVIMCAQNEEENIRNYLKSVITQTYPTFEVVVIDDCSEDDTEFYVSNLARDYPHITYRKIVKDEKFRHNKKLAITLGIKAAKYNHFVFIDADCYPVSEHWLQHMSSKFSETKHIVLGYGGYEKQSGFLDKLVRYDTFSIAVQYLSYAHAGIPYMAVGRNLAYDRTIYEQSSKFRNHYHIRSGDDDLFVSETATRKNTAISLHPESFTRSVQVTSFFDWRAQKRRHLSTSKKYSLLHKLLLLVEPFSKFVLYVALVLYLVFGITNMYIPVISVVSARFLILLIINNCAMNRLKEKKLLVYSLLFDLVLPIIILILHIQNKIFSHTKR